MPLEQPARDPGRGTRGRGVGLVPHSRRDEAAVGEPRDAVEVAVLLQQDAALPRERGRRPAKIEVVDFDGFAGAMARGVETEAPRRSLCETQAMGIEGLQVQ